MIPDLRYRLLQGAWLLLCFSSPPLVALAHVSWARRAPHRASRARRQGGVLTLLTLLTVTPFAWLMAAWTSPPPGESEAARAFKERAAPVVRALAEYRQAVGRYPDSLAALEPRFLEPGVLPLAHAQPGLQVRYARQGAAGDGYQLDFAYRFGGYYECRYTPDAGRWRCWYRK